MKSFVEYSNVGYGSYENQDFKEGDEIVITTKLNGIAARYGWHLYEANTWWKKVLRFFNLVPKWVFCYGNKWTHITKELEDNHISIYNEIAKQEAFQYLRHGYTVYGEIVGAEAYTDHHYGCLPDQHMFYCYDVRDNVNNKWLDHDDMEEFCLDHGIDTVPVQFRGHYTHGMVANYIDYNPISTETNEGVVVKHVKEQDHPMGRQIFKFINRDFNEEMND